MVRGCPPGMGHSVEMIRFFTEFILSEILQSLLSFRMTASEGFRMTIISISPIATQSPEGGGKGEGTLCSYFLITHL